LGLLEINKIPSVNIWFTAKVITTPGANLTSVMINLEFQTNYTMRYGYMVLVIGYQPENTLIDLFDYKMTDTELGNLSTPLNKSRSKSWLY
jgi:hypothetical protein